MSKIICDVCGTSYPETSSQCPICGSVRDTELQTVVHDSADPDATSAGSYQFVKGGRFSKANVRKRALQYEDEVVRQNEDPQSDDEDDEYEEEDGSNKGLILTAVALFLAILAVCIYIAIRMFGPGTEKPAPTVPEEPSTQAPVNTEPEETTTEGTQEVTVPCTMIVLDETEITLEEIGATARITAAISPSDTTDPVTYVSSDPSVISVSEDGEVKALAAGEAIITVSCGEQTAKCTVTCTYVEFALNRSDITMQREGEEWTLYTGNIPLTDITWMSMDESVATVVNGKVVAVGEGKTTIRATYNNVTADCIVRCKFTN